MSRIPEGFIPYAKLAKRFKLHNKGADLLQAAIDTGLMARVENILYDPERLTAEQALENSRWYTPGYPQTDAAKNWLQAAIADREIERLALLRDLGDPAAERIMQRLKATTGYTTRAALCQAPGDTAALQILLDAGAVEQYDNFIYDPLRLSEPSMAELTRRLRLQPFLDKVRTALEARPAHTAPYAEMSQLIDDGVLDELLKLDSELSEFQITVKPDNRTMRWVRLASANPDDARNQALEATQIRDEDWEPLLKVAGDLVRPDAASGHSFRALVVGRTYTLKSAARKFNVRQQTLEAAIDHERIPGFIDPEGQIRLPANEVEAASNDLDYHDRISGLEEVTVRDLSMVSGMKIPSLRKWLSQHGYSRSTPYWEDVRGKLELPPTLDAFRDAVRNAQAQRRVEREHLFVEEQRRLAEEYKREQQEREHQRTQREQLRSKLVAAFPAWKHAGRADQQIVLHVGPPNSGKTHDALNALSKVESGWYLAPLRLLAFEVFDRLNVRGVYTNLLTGEEHHPVPGATVTAATIEMFNPTNSGDVVVIDEAQMLGDPDRGWAWTRALMEARAQTIHIISPPTARELIERMATAAAIPLTVIEHNRLAPVKVADEPWPLKNLPPRTILVAFSRHAVLQLKAELEKRGRTVSVIYGNLPPEVRRNQADRFASGQTEICVATDAVGMGLNLPADYVCFYELSKFDGKSIRNLTSGEVQQIGGRAGRFGLSTAGEIGATNRKDLTLLRRLFHAEADPITHARVAPSVEDLEMIPGSLAEKLRQWALLESIPDALRQHIKTADMTERIELAIMLSNREVDFLGLSVALRLVNAPTRQSTRSYWYACTRAILTNRPMPLPPPPPPLIENSTDLEAIEHSITCADIYLWLSQRQEFEQFAPDEPEMRLRRGHWSERIEAALLQNVNLGRRCAQCGMTLPLGHRFKMCNNCYSKQFYYEDNDAYSPRPR